MLRSPLLAISSRALSRPSTSKYWVPTTHSYHELRLPAQRLAAPAPAPFPSRSFSSSLSRRSTQPERYEGQPLTSSEYRGQGARSTKRPWYRSPTTLVLAFIPIFTFWLGTWQIQRLKWKVGLIEELEDKLRKEPMRLPKNINLEALSSFDFRLVQLEGTFDHSRIIFLGPRVREGVNGFHVVVPFARSEGGGEVLVNRGFVAKNQTVGEGAQRRLKDGANVAPTGKVNLLTLLPRIYPPIAFTPANDASKGAWFHADPPAMAEYLSGSAGALPLGPSAGQPGAAQGDRYDDAYTPSAGIAESVKEMISLGRKEEKRVLPVLLEEIFEGHAGEASQRVASGVPVGRAPTIELRNQHAVYAATWFSLSAATAAMFALLVRRGR